jgi:hypothetical protein
MGVSSSSIVLSRLNKPDHLGADQVGGKT